LATIDSDSAEASIIRSLLNQWWINSFL